MAPALSAAVIIPFWQAGRLDYNRAIQETAMHELHALPAETLQLLEDFLDGDDNTDGLDFIATHGYLTALAVGPETPAPEVWLPALFDNQPVAADQVQAAAISEALLAYGEGRPIANPEAFGYMLRALFDSMRRHIAFEQDCILTVLPGGG